MILAARLTDVARLQQIEVAAGEAFRFIGMDLVADDEPLGGALLTSYISDGLAWVRLDADVVAAYLVADAVDGALHIEQVSVHPDYAHRRYGQSLIEHAAAEARQAGYDVLTLTTYRDVAWNGPYYRRLGFEVVADDDLSPGLAAIREHERNRGLDRWARVAMRCSLR